MDIRKLKQEYPVLLDYMKQQGYGKVSIGGVQVRLKELFEQEGNYASYGDFYEKLLKRKGISKAMNARSIIGSLYEGLRHLMNMVICLIALPLYLLYNKKVQ